MAQKGLYEQAFTDTDTITVSHSLNLDYIGGIRLVVGSRLRPDLIKQVNVSKTDPTNSLTVELNQVCSGRIQIVGTDYVRIGQSTVGQAARSITFGYATDLTERQTNSIMAEDAVVLTTEELPAGDYLIEWSGEAKISRLNNQAIIKVVVDGGNTICDSFVGSKSWAMFSGFEKIVHGGSAPITVRLQFGSEAGGSVAAYIRRATIKIKPAEQ